MDNFDLVLLATKEQDKLESQEKELKAAKLAAANNAQNVEDSKSNEPATSELDKMDDEGTAGVEWKPTEGDSESDEVVEVIMIDQKPPIPVVDLTDHTE
eukprot:548874-Pleurochrysis_carterae.AAC.1